jgi:predicted Zn finger-like uncharacterized protein
MNIICPHCNTRLNIPDHKIPKDKDSSFKCPKCQDKIQVSASQFNAPVAESQRKEAVKKEVMESGGSSSQGQASALIMMADSTYRSKLVSVVQGLGFYVETTASISEALKKMAYQLYPFVIVEDSSELSKAVAAMFIHMNELDTSLRRRIFLVLLSDQLPTGDPMSALHASVNYVLGSDSLDHAAQLLSSALTEHRNFYTVYNESMRAAGKA